MRGLLDERVKRVRPYPNETRGNQDILAAPCSLLVNYETMLQRSRLDLFSVFPGQEASLDA